jgi:hypothetical protein
MNNVARGFHTKRDAYSRNVLNPLHAAQHPGERPT